MKCPSCSAENNDAAKFCKKCGGRLPAPSSPATETQEGASLVACSVCGHARKADAKFCPSCGQSTHSEMLDGIGAQATAQNTESLIVLIPEDSTPPIQSQSPVAQQRSTRESEPSSDNVEGHAAISVAIVSSLSSDASTQSIGRVDVPQATAEEKEGLTQEGTVEADRPGTASSKGGTMSKGLAASAVATGISIASTQAASGLKTLAIAAVVKVGVIVLIVIAGGIAASVALMHWRGANNGGHAGSNTAVVSPQATKAANMQSLSPAIANTAPATSGTTAPATVEVGASGPSQGGTVATTTRDNIAARLNEILKAAASGDWRHVDETISSLKRAASAASGDVSRARALNDEGLKALRRGDSDAAIRNFAEAALADPDDSEARNNLGFAYLRKGNIAEANKHISASLQLAPDRGVAWANVAEVFAEKDNESASRAALKVAVHLSTNRQRTLEFLSRADETIPSQKFRAVAVVVLREVDGIPAGLQK